MFMKDKPFKEHRTKQDVPAALPMSAPPEPAKRTGKYTENQIPSPDHEPVNTTTLLLAGILNPAIKTFMSLQSVKTAAPRWVEGLWEFPDSHRKYSLSTNS